MEGRRAQFAAEVASAQGLTLAGADKVVSQAIDRWVWYAGWSDKIAQVLGGVNPVAGPYFNISSPEPTGVVAALAPQRCSLLGLVSVLAPIVVSGNTAVVLTSEHRPLPAITLSEVLATSDVPGGVINLITGRTAEVAPWLAAHQDVNAIDLTGAADADALVWAELEGASTENLKRVLRPAGDGVGAVEPDWSPTPDLTRIKFCLETKTVWHPKGG
jgi:acyl-CoA reductase-like NAD-dependent aldehyde dehydrogenase